MARAAGDSPKYRIGIIDARGRLVEELAGFPSVTTVLGAADGDKLDAMVGWSFNVTVEALAKLLESGKIKPGMSVPTMKQRIRSAQLHPTNVRDEAAERGSHIHDLAERLLKGTVTYDEVLEATPSAWRGYARGLVKWHTQYDNSPVAVERTLVSVERQFAGTCDLIDVTKDRLTRVMDFKTSKRLYDSQFIQGTAYAFAWEEMQRRLGTPVTVDQVGVIRFTADGDYEEKARPYTGADVFLRMLALYGATNGGK